MEDKLRRPSADHRLLCRQHYREIRACLLSLVFLCLVSCGSDRQTFLLEGTFKGFNQGELYIYGIDGTHPLDTIAVQKGQFRYEVLIDHPVIFNIVFPNFSELPVFGEPRADVQVEGDASHLRETAVSGTSDNKEMTTFRKETAQQPPPEVAKAAEALIRQQPETPVAYYLLNKYFTQNPDADHSKTIALTDLVSKAQPGQKQLLEVSRRLHQSPSDTGRLPQFSATDVNGNRVDQSALSGEVNIVTVWAKWNYESINQQRQIDQLRRDNPDKVKILSICLDPDVKGCRQTLAKDSVRWSTVCTGKMWDTPLLWQLGFTKVPDNLIADRKGKIIARGLRPYELINKGRELLKPKSD